MNNECIEVGDTVIVEWGSGERFQGVVKVMPTQPMEPWIIVHANGTVMYCQQYESIIKDIAK